VKTLLVIFLFFTAEAYAAADKIDIRQVRALYKKSATSKKACTELSVLLSRSGHGNPLLLGYKGSNVMMMAKYAFNPFTKMSHFKKGKEMLEKAVRLDSKNVELRLLRFVNQTNAPSFLAYNDHVETDKKFILAHLASPGEPGARDFIVTILQESKYLNSEEKQQIK
jgi:hypothetical protein